MKRLGVLALAAGMASAVPAAAQEDARAVLSRSWSSHHWAVLAPIGEGSQRVALVVDIDTVTTDGPDKRAFSYLILMYGRPALYGAVNRIAVDCGKATSQDLYSGFFEGGKLIDFSDKPSPPEAHKKGAILTEMSQAVCGRNWAGMKLLDVPAAEIGTAAFAG